MKYNNNSFNEFNKPLVIDIKVNSLDDGPGIRTVIFFKGCNLDCIWCQNPESKSSAIELLYERDKCIGCNSCIDSCTLNAISPENEFFVDRTKCTLCLECVKACPSTALSIIGKEMMVNDIIHKIIKYKPFYDISGGGVTLSGGEPTLSLEFISKLLKKLKSEGIYTLIETNGLFDFRRFKSLILPFLDVIYMDIKFINQEVHKKYCGVSNKVILENFSKLLDLSSCGKFTIIPRTPLIPNITDTDENVQSIIQFLKKNEVHTASILKNNPLWLEKCDKLGISHPLQNDHSVCEFYNPDKYEKIKAIFQASNIDLIES